MSESAATESAEKPFHLTISPREKHGTTSSNNYRKAGLLPAVAYELGKDSVSFLLDTRNFSYEASRALTSQIFTLGDGVKEIAGRKVLVKEIQRGGLKGNLLHVDLLLLEEKRPAAVTIPIVVTGEAPGVKKQGGVLTTACRQITVLSPPEAIPSELEVSVSELALGQRIRTKDIKLPEGVTLKSSPEETVANVIAGRAAKLDGAGDSQDSSVEEQEAPVAE